MVVNKHTMSMQLLFCSLTNKAQMISIKQMQCMLWNLRAIVNMMVKIYLLYPHCRNILIFMSMLCNGL